MSIIRFRVTGDGPDYNKMNVTEDNICRFVEYDTIASIGFVYYVDPTTHEFTDRDPYHLDSDRAFMHAIGAWLDAGHQILPGWQDGGIALDANGTEHHHATA
jgi:hypothetical protein